MSIGCLLNWSKHRSFHCQITAPLFLIAGILFLFLPDSMIHADGAWVWAVVMVGVILAFLLEFQFARDAL